MVGLLEVVIFEGLRQRFYGIPSIKSKAGHGRVWLPYRLFAVRPEKPRAVEMDQV
jgi:hypothetical protein